MKSTVLPPEPPIFSLYQDPEGFGGGRVTSRYLRDVYT